MAISVEIGALRVVQGLSGEVSLGAVLGRAATGPGPCNGIGGSGPCVFRCRSGTRDGRSAARFIWGVK